MAEIFRKSSLDKLSSPEQLDKMIVITPPSFWIALSGAALIIVAALIWAVFGRLPMKEDAQGIYVNDGETYSVYAEVSGMVEEVLVQEGEAVEVGTPLVRVNEESVQKEITKLEERIDFVEAVTLTSENDKLTSDTQSLIDIKNQIDSAGNKTESEMNLEIIREKIYEQTKVVKMKKEARDKAKKEYEIAMDCEPEVSVSETITKKVYPETQTLEDGTVINAATGLPVTEKELAGVEQEVSNPKYEEAFAKEQKRIQKLQQDKQEKYQEASNEYSTEEAALNSLKESKIQTEDQIKIQSNLNNTQIKTQKEQFEDTKELALEQLYQELAQYKEQLTDCIVKSTMAGTVRSIEAVPGGITQQGGEILKVHKGSENNTVICYMPIGSGKKIKEGMKVLVYPSTVNRQEYGHMEGVIEHVDDYVTTNTDLLTQLGNSNLAESFLANGPVVAVRCRLTEDKNTASGYYWSSDKGSDLVLLEGTLVDANIVLEEKAPITMLIPFLKEKLTIKVGEAK